MAIPASALASENAMMMAVAEKWLMIHGEAGICNSLERLGSRAAAFRRLVN